MRRRKKNIIILKDDYIVIKIDKHADKEYLVDKEDYERIKDFTWGCTAHYACTKINQKHILLHRLIFILRGLNIENLEIDHKNRNRLDNRFDNLRICSKIQNRRNRTKIEGGTSKYKGVSFDSERNEFVCNLASKYHNINYSKRFDTEIEAALKYNELATQYFGEFANLNKI